MTQLVLIKHSAVIVEAAVPANQWQLSEAGKRLCRPLATALRMHELDLLVSSEETKAIETAQIVAKRLRLDTRSAPDLDEHRRPFVDAPTDFERQVARFFSEPTRRVFGEESADEALARFQEAIYSVLAAEPGRNVGIVTHGSVIALFAAPMFGVGTGALWQRLTSPSFLVVDLEAKRGLRIVDDLE